MIRRGSPSKKGMILSDLLMQFGVLLGQGFSLGGKHEHDRGGFLGLGSNAELHPAADENVGDGSVLAQDWDVADDIDGRDVGSDDDDPLRALLDGLDHVLDPALQVFFPVEVAHQLEDLPAESIVGERRGDGRVVESLRIFRLHRC